MIQMKNNINKKYKPKIALSLRCRSEQLSHQSFTNLYRKITQVYIQKKGLKKITNKTICITSKIIKSLERVPYTILN